jgi:hypothetical protein
MGVVDTTYTFSSTDTITSSKLNNIIDDTFFTSTAISGSTLQIVSPGKLAVAAGGITSNELADNSVTSAKIVDGTIVNADISDSAAIAGSKIDPIFGTPVTIGSGVSTGNAAIELGSPRTGDGNSFIDFHSSASQDYDARIIRYGGANGIFDLSNTGTGVLQIVQDNNAPISLATSNTARVRIQGNGYVGIGTTSPATGFHVNWPIRYTNKHAAGSGTYLVIDSEGDIKPLGSSLRYKNSVQNYQKGLDAVKSLNSVTFKFNGDDNVTAGFIAEELDSNGFSEFVVKDNEGRPDSIQYAQMVALLVNAIKELSDKVDQLEQK